MSKQHDENDFKEDFDEANIEEQLDAAEQSDFGEETGRRGIGSDDDEIAELLSKVAALTEALQRERADATNLRRRHDAQIAGLKAMVKASVVRDLLPVIDNFERALKHAPKELEANDFVKGVQGLVKQFEKTLAELGVQKIKTVGEPFNPHLHEAVSMDDGNGDEEIVSEELQAGYQLGHGEDAEVLRTAMVKVKTA